MSKYRGLYGAPEGHEKRSQSEVFADRLAENELVEGEYLRRMKAAAESSEMDLLAAIREEMKVEYVKSGISSFSAQERADSVLRQALVHLQI